MEIREYIRHYRYDLEKYKGKEIIDFAFKSIKLITSNIDKLYYNIWKDLSRIDFKLWADFIVEFRCLYGKLKETGQEVIAKLASIHLFDKIRMYLSIWVEINKTRYLMDPDLDKLLLELETRGRQLEYDNVTLVNLRSHGNQNLKEFVSESQGKRAVQQNQRMEKKFAQKDGFEQGQN
jgi:hypothetical protein